MIKHILKNSSLIAAIILFITYSSTKNVEHLIFCLYFVLDQKIKDK